MDIVALDAYAANPGDISWEGFRSLGSLTVYDRSAPDEVISRIGGAEIVLVNKIYLDESVFARTPRLSYIGLLSTGYNMVELEAAKAHGITVTNVPDYSTAAVVQHTFALLLELCAHIGHHSQVVREGAWAKNPDFCFWDKPLTELLGKTMGIVGFGRIGTAVARAATAFGMRVLASAKRQRADSGIPGAEMTDLDVLFAESDIISLHCPLTPDNRHMLRAETIAKMRDGVIIINTARGGLINEAELSAALVSGKVAAFGADVLENEPPEPGNPLVHAPNTVITPHIAWAPRETRERLYGIALDNLRAYLEGRPQNVVN
jgi:glycerate dehydrogenase